MAFQTIWDPYRVLFQVNEQPRFEVLEKKEGFVLSADLPGVKEEDLEITVQKNLLTVAGKREGRGAFERKFTLPGSVDAEAVHAELKNGVLTLTVPKKPEVQPRKIAITAAQQKSAA